MTWSDSSITNCQLMGTMFLESSFSKLTVKGSRLERFCARGGLWREIDLFECTVFMTMWIEIKMSMSSFRHSTLHRVLFQKDCTVERADFSDSKLLLVNIQIWIYFNFLCFFLDIFHTTFDFFPFFFPIISSYPIISCHW